MTIKLKNGCKIRKENFGGILRAPSDSILLTGQSFYELDELSYFILAKCMQGCSAL